MKRKAKKKLTQQPWFAALLLAAGVTVALGSFRSQFGGGGEDGSEASSVIDELEPDEGQLDGIADSGPRRDLVAEFGGYDGASPWPDFLAALPDAAVSALVPAAPGGEVGKTTGAWTGEAPPRLVIGVVFVGQGSRRAVVAGKVVGVGDRVGETRIESIERNGLLVAWRNRLLTYDMNSDYPQEYRAEAARRASAEEREQSKENEGAGK